MTHRRHFLAGAAALISMPGMALAKRLSTWEGEMLREYGTKITTALSSLKVEGGLMDDHYRIRIPTREIFAQGDDTELMNVGVKAATVIAETLDHLGYWKAEIVGHKAGRNSYQSFIISERQSAALKAAIASRGIQAARLQVTGLGNRFPVAPRFNNDRIEFLLRSIPR